MNRSSLLSTQSAPLFTLNRQGHEEVVVHGITHAGDAEVGEMDDVRIVARSLLKPFQAVALASEVLCKAAGNRLALALASHSGQPQHIEALTALAGDLKVEPSHLLCPACFPMDTGEGERMRAEKAIPARLCHPCAGKHLFMLAACAEAKLPFENYLSSDHRIQQRIKESVESIVHSSLDWVTDSCGVPTAVLTVRSLIDLFKHFAQDSTPGATALKDAWIKSPNLVGGHGRLDSQLTTTFAGRLIAKEGADGLLIVQSIERGDTSTAFVKISSGYNSKYLALGLLSALKRNRKLNRLFQELAGYLETQLAQYHPQDQLPEFL